MSDALEQATETLKAAMDIIQKDAQKSPTMLAGDYAWTAEQCLHAAQAAALIALAEEIRTLNATLHDMTDLNGAAKVTLAHDTVIKIAQ